MKNKIRIARETQGQSQSALARKIGITRQTLSAIEANKQEPSLQIGLRIAQTLGYTVEQLFQVLEKPSTDQSSQTQLYQDILDLIFGKGVCKISPKLSRTNNLIGAICWERDSTFQSFRQNFINRLNRLKFQYESDLQGIKVIQTLAQNVAYGDGNGAYAELAAIDYLNRMYKHIIGSPAKLHVDVDANRTFAKTKQMLANIDALIEDLSTFIEVKLLQDITEGILHKAIAEFNQKYNANILVERDYAYDYETIKDNFSGIKNELESALQSRKTFCKSKLVNDLAFRIMWSPGVNAVAGILDPYKAAFIRHKAVFDYAAQYVKDKPFVLCLTTPPWTNTGLTSFQDTDNIFYRALSRRVFCQYIDSPEKHPEFGVSLEEISRSISMLVFLKLNDTLGDEKDTISAHVFANPNAHHRYPGFLKDFFNEQGVAIQEFEWDNY